MVISIRWRSIIYYVVFASCVSIDSVSASLLGLSPKLFNKRIQDLQNSTNKNLSDIKAGINDVQFRLGKIETKLDANINMTAKVQAGYDRSKTQTAGRDITTKTSIINDTGLLKTIIMGLLGIILFLIRDAAASRKWLRNALASKEKYKQKHEELLDKLKIRE